MATENSTEELEALRARVRELEGKVKDARDEQQAFIYAVSHDLRAPLRAIMSSCMILLEDCAPQLDSEGKSELKRQSEAARKLNGLLEELLKLSRLARHEMVPENLDLGQIARASVLEVGADPDSILVVEGSVEGVGDARLLKLVFQEFAKNSIKFARKDVPLKVVLRKDGDSFVLSDNGIGFDHEQARRIFLPFERLNGEEYPGTGMGLALVKRVLDRHDGHITADGVPGEGAVFRFTLP